MMQPTLRVGVRNINCSPLTTRSDAEGDAPDDENDDPDGVAPPVVETDAVPTESVGETLPELPPSELISDGGGSDTVARGSPVPEQPASSAAALTAASSLTVISTRAADRPGNSSPDRAKPVAGSSHRAP